MEFLVKLIEVTDTQNEDAREDLQGNCTHVAHNFWLFEGDEEALHPGISFHIIGEAAIEAYGDLSGSELKRMAREAFNVDAVFLQ